MLTNLDALTSADTSAEETTLPIRKFRRPAQPDAAVADSTLAQRVYMPFRRLLDFTLALAVCLIAAPVVLLAAALVRLSSRGPAFYSQTRVGRAGKLFTIYKIRSMIHNCESLTGPRWTIPGDPRVTPIGWLLRRTHIDELPQLVNVLIGNMSLIGPRPERPEFVAELEQAIPDYQQRHAVLPGITGLAQVQLAPDTDLESVRSKLQCDLHFIRHLSIWLDARILLATVLHMLGASFTRLQRLGIVPTPAQAETPMRDVQPEGTPLVHRQAA